MVNWSDQEYITEIVSSSYCYADCLRKLGLHISSGNYNTLKKYISEHEIDTSHFDPHKKLREGRSSARPLKEILVKNSDYTNTYHLKKRLIRSGKLPEKCNKCGLTEWMGEDISLQLDHINGVNDDHRLENLRLLCPNCHSQTDTYAGSNSKTEIEPNTCVDCEDQIHQESTRCKSCAAKHRAKTSTHSNHSRKFDPPSEKLKQLVWKIPVTKVADHFNVSDTTVRKRCQDYGIETPGVGYWQKKHAEKN